MKRYIPLLYIPIMLLILVRLAVVIEVVQASYMKMGFGYLDLLWLGLVFAEVFLYYLFRRYASPRILVLITLGFLAFPIHLFWVLSNIFDTIPNGTFYIFTSPNAFVGKTLLAIEVMDLLSSKVVSRGD